MHDDAPSPSVPHHINCVCARCREARAAEVRRRLEEQRREDRRSVLAYREELAGRGLVFKPAKPQPGTIRALAKMSRRAS